MNTNRRPAPVEPMTTEELTAIRKRLGSVGLFTAHAYTDVTRLLAEVHRLRAALTASHGEPPTSRAPDAA
jgi:hypothetical protein